MSKGNLLIRPSCGTASAGRSRLSLSASAVTRSLAKTSTEAVIMSSEPSTHSGSSPRSIITQEDETQATVSSVESSVSVRVSLMA